MSKIQSWRLDFTLGERKCTGYFLFKAVINKRIDLSAMQQNFKGIEFVRISALPEDQKEKIWQSFQQDKIIKIVKDQALMNDCILYQDYVLWLKQQEGHLNPAVTAANPQPAFLKLAFK